MTSHRGFVTGDFDNYVTPGTWDYGGSGATHAPTSEGGKLRVKPGYYITQEYVAESQDYSRIKLESGWSSWRRGITNSDLSLSNATLSAGQDGNGPYIIVTGVSISLIIRFNTAQKEVAADVLMNGAWSGQRVIASWAK